MSEHEFEIYLSLLSRLVKLTPDQTAAIADELRDHLEQRFVELVRQGLDREAAIRQALEEFGDASGLAMDLTRVSRKRIPKWVIRSTAATAVIATTVIAGVFLFAPPDSVPNAPATAQAQPESKASQPAKPSPKLSLEDGPDDLEASFLDQPLAVEFDNLPLTKALQLIAEQGGVPLVIDETALAEDGVDSNVPISISIGTIPTVKSKTPKPNQQPKPIVQNSPTAIPLGDALNIMLQDLELNYYVKEGILHITSQNMHDEFCITRIYDVRSLFARGITPESLQSAIQNTTSGPWRDVDGTGGEYALVDNVLTVRQSYHGQREVRGMLESINNPTGQHFAMHHDATIAAQDVLATMVTANFDNVPLVDALDSLSRAVQTPLRLDLLALSEESIDGQQVHITCKLNEQRLETVLNTILRPLGLDFVVRFGEVLVSTEYVVYQSMQTAVYDLRDLNDPHGRLTEFVEAIPLMTEGPWQDVEGDGGSIVCLEDGTLCVRHGSSCHRRLESILRLVRRSFLNGLPPTGRSKELITRFYQMPMETAEDLIDALPEMVQPPSWKSKANPDGGTIRVLSLGRKVTIPIPGDKTDGSKNKTNTQKTSQTSHREKKPVIPGDRRDRFSQRSTRNWNTNPPTVLLQRGRPSTIERHLMGVGVKGTSGYTTVVNVAAPPNAVLVIQQTRAIHLKIDQLLLSMGLVTSGEDYVKESEVKWHRADRNYRSGGGGGMGTPSGFGMGGGFFNVPSR